MSILEDSVRRQLRVECSEIGLTKRGTVPLDFKGPGIIWFDKDGQINFEFSLTQEENRTYDLRQAADAQPDVKGLVFAAAAETLIRACFPNIRPINSDFRQKVRALQRQIEDNTELDSDLRTRASGALNGLLSSPNSERIREFLRWHVRDRQLQDALFDDWKELRDGSAHGGKIRSEADYVTLRRIKSTQDLCYAIVLSRICYYHERWWNVEAKRYANSWSLHPLSQSLSGKPPVGSTIVPSGFQWPPQKGGFRKDVLVGKEPKQAITLIVRPRKDGSCAA
jgi:hypothetical protein